MPAVRIMTNSGAEITVEAPSFQAFQDSVRGMMIRPGDANYDSARKTWNGMIDKHPALITRCTGVADVIAAVRFARDHELLVAVRGGGHSLPGFSVCEGGMVIDLSPMKGMRVEPGHALRCRPGRPHLGRL
jgi:FAD/FMN-containing dehydrogenase